MASYLRRASNVGVRFGLVGLTAILLAGCGVSPVRDGPPDGYPDVSSIPDAVPRAEPRSRYGNPRSYVVNGKRYHTLAQSRGYVERGIASWYGKKFHGRRTSSGEVYNMYAMTAAHKQLPLPTFVEVLNLENGRTVIVRVNDRGPFHPNRVIDLSYAAAQKLGILRNGTGLVELRAIDPAHRGSRNGRMVNAEWRKAGFGLYLQVGAFMYRSNAERLTARLQPLAGGAVRISETLKGDETIYRVRYGPLGGVEEADRLVSALLRTGIDDFHIVLE